MSDETYEHLKRACAQTRAALQKAKPPAPYAAVLREMHREFEKVSQAVMEARDVRLACRDGCAFCCHLKVDAHAHEVLFAADDLRRRLTADEIEGVVRRSREHAKRIGAMSAIEQKSTNNPCPLLVENRCVAYEARPLSCRCHHATRVQPCEELFQGGDPTKPIAENEPLKIAASAVWVGIKRGFDEEGYDPSTYDFGSAIGEALENPVTARRWRDGKLAFSSQALAKTSQPRAAENPRE